MDQLACVYGKTNQAMFISCETEELEYAEFDLTGYQFVLINSNVEHKLDESSYNDRHMEYMESISIIDRIFGHRVFMNIEMGTFEANRSSFDEVLFNGAKHLITENQRVLQTKMALSVNSFDVVGRLLSALHASLKNDYEVTVAETDFLVKQLTSRSGVLGARQMGGGFGGCVIAL